MKKWKRLITFVMACTLGCSASLVLKADSYYEYSNIASEFSNDITPYYEIMHRPYLKVDNEGVVALLEADKVCSLKIEISVYKQEGTKWHLSERKTFTKESRALKGSFTYNFESNEHYKVTADFYANDEYEQLEEYYIG